MNEELYDLAFALEQSITRIEKIYLFNRFGSAKEVLKFNKHKIKTILQRGWTGKNYEPPSLIEKAASLLPFMEKASINTLRFDNKKFPFGLKQIPDPPYLLFYRGNLDFDYYKSIAIVGTRKPDPTGIDRTVKFSAFLTKQGFTIVSGLALGVDGLAHKYCVGNQGKTIAVLGCGIDRIYPAQNRSIGRSILDTGGAIVSEYPPGIEPRRWYFPQRNRIIVGLSRSVLIIQSPERSGSLISANLAADYNRDLYVVEPGKNIIDKGNLNLINNGAQEIKIPEEILYNYLY